MAVIGIDLDGTLAKFTKWEGGAIVGAPDPGMVHVLQEIQMLGHIVCIWTTRPDYVARNWLQQHELGHLVHCVNTSPYPSESGKASFDAYIGDDAITWENNPHEVMHRVKALPREFTIERDRAFSSHNPKPYLAGVGQAYVDMFERHWRDAWRRHRSANTTAFVTICSHAKPYSKSFIHSSIRAYLHDLDVLNTVDYVHISNAGLVPASAEMDYPFNAYDWDGTLCTVEDTAYHKAAIERRLKEWLSTYTQQYTRIVFYLRDGGNTHSVARLVLGDVRDDRCDLVSALDGPDYRLDFAAMKDPDDCLTHRRNLNKLARMFL